MALPALLAPFLRTLLKAVAEDLVKDVAAEASSFDLSISVELDLSNLLKLKGKARQAVYRGVNRAAKPVREAVVARATAIKLHGFTAKSIGTKTRMYARGIITVIGPKMSFSRKRPGKAATRGAGKGTRPNVAPYRYAWLIEFGTVRSKIKAFLQPAWDQAGPGYRKRVVGEIAAELAKVTGNAG